VRGDGRGDEEGGGWFNVIAAHYTRFVHRLQNSDVHQFRHICVQIKILKLVSDDGAK